VDTAAVRLVPRDLAERSRLIAIGQQDHELTVAMADPLNVLASDEVQRVTGYQVRRVLARAEDIAAAIAAHYAADFVADAGTSLAPPVQTGDHDPADQPPLAADTTEADEAAKADERFTEAPVVRFINSVIARALKDRASDIHVEPGLVEGIIRCRVDGALHDLMAVSLDVYPAVVSRLKIMANMDISERRVPQDGRFSMTLEHRPIDFRVSSLPTVLGEKMVLRILDKSKTAVSTEQLGLSEQERVLLEEVVSSPHGMFVVTGPTGSGKTTTLYAVLQKLNRPETNIVTCEDPVEYQLDRINQAQLNVRAGLTFGSFLRSVLRQDPDVIMVGEIRDAETVELAIRAALTGHLVLTTLHTNNAVGAATRLVDMGAEPYLLASTLTAALAQRLVRRICPECKETYRPAPDSPEAALLAAEGGEPFAVCRGHGCRACDRLGYLGRRPVFELFVPDVHMRKLIYQRADADVLGQAAQAAGMTTLREAALRLARAGETTLEEVLRVTRG
jgi:type IV pilus assembly protein PilB